MSSVTYLAKRGIKLIGDEKGAWMAGKDAGIMDSSPLVINGSFTTDTSGWTKLGDGTIASVSGELEVVFGTSSTQASQNISVIVGETYVVRWVARRSPSAVALMRVTGAANLAVSVSSTTNLVYQETFVATSNSLAIGCRIDSSGTAYFDDVSLRIVVKDHSASNNGLFVYGLINRSSVSVGSELVAYSGFSSLNYLAQPYNSDFNLGTGDFCYIGWYSKTSDGYSNAVHRGSSSSSNVDAGTSLSIATKNDGYLTLSLLAAGVNDGRITLDTSGSFNMFAFVRISGVVYAYQNGLLESSIVVTKDMSDTGIETLFIGRRASTSNPNPWTSGSVCNVRVLNHGITAAQIKDIYNSEKHLFRNHSTYTKVGDSYSVDIPIQSASPSTNTVKTDSQSIGGQIETIVDRNDEYLDITTGLMYRTDTTKMMTSSFNEFMYATRGSEPFTLDLYGTLSAPSEPEEFVRVGQHAGPAPVSDTNGIYRASFKVKKL